MEYYYSLILILNMAVTVALVLYALGLVKKRTQSTRVALPQHKILSIINYLPGFFLGPLFFEYAWRYLIMRAPVSFTVGATFIFGFVLLCAALYMYVDTLKYMGKYWSTGVVLFSKHRVLTEHCFSFVRHPIYVAWFLIFIAFWLMTEDPRFGISLGVVFAWYLFRSEVEERFLVQQLPGYILYKKKTRRFIPLLF